MNRFNNLTLPILLFIAISCNPIKDKKDSKFDRQEKISVELPETYELANVILALTEYGKTDKWEVRKGFDYYDKMQGYFKSMINHPLLDSVNYSRKRWAEYLSFRTDAYAFKFDANDKLKRYVEFYTTEDISPFDQHLDLVNDFVDKSNFRNFFVQNMGYYQRISDEYKRTQYINEMRSFLIMEFGEQLSFETEYKIVLSPFVFRMNCHRTIDSNITADFIPVPDYVLTDTVISNEKDIVTSIHTLFTEMDHGYVNPTTEKYNIEEKFDESLWDDKSGYTGGENAVFNEYMTWAVFDIFSSIQFPELANNVNLNWHFQNDTRGLIYSNLFAAKLKEIYFIHEGKKKIKDLYPEMLEWTQERQAELTKPILLNDSDTLFNTSKKNLIKLQFSEPMEKVETFDLILQFSQAEKVVIKIDDNNSLKWNNEGESLSFELKLPHYEKYYLLLNGWGVENPLISKKGVMLKAASGLIIQ